MLMNQKVCECSLDYVSLFLFIRFLILMIACAECLEVGDPLTAEELEEKERLLEEVSVFSQRTKFLRQALFNLVIW